MRELYYRDMLSMSDLYFAPIYAIFILLFFTFIRNLLYQTDNPIRKYFIPALLIKMVGAVSIGMVYFFYYHGGGDTGEYWNNALVFNTAYNDSPDIFWKLLINPPDDTIPEIQEYVWWSFFRSDIASYTVGKITGVINLFTFNIYSACALIFAVLSFTGVWAMYTVFCDIYPKLYKQFAIAVLFVPSVFFWGSGILKDSVTLGCVGWLTYCSYQIFFKGRFLFLGTIILLITGYLTFIIKSYIIFGFVPALVLWIFLYYKSSIKSGFLRAVLNPIVYGIVLAGGVVAIQKLGNDFIARANNFQTYHGILEETGVVGSGYNLGELDGTFDKVPQKVPSNSPRL